MCISALNMWGFVYTTIFTLQGKLYLLQIYNQQVCDDQISATVIIKMCKTLKSKRYNNVTWHEY